MLTSEQEANSLHDQRSKVVEALVRKVKFLSGLSVPGVDLSSMIS